VQLVSLHAAAQYNPDQEQKHSCTSDQLHVMGYWKINCLSTHDDDTKHDQEPNPTQNSPSKGKRDGSTPGTQLPQSMWGPPTYYVSVGISVKLANPPKPLSVKELV